jgi:hypothetical protein
LFKSLKSKLYLTFFRRFYLVLLLRHHVRRWFWWGLGKSVRRTRVSGEPVMYVMRRLSSILLLINPIELASKCASKSEYLYN